MKKLNKILLLLLVSTTLTIGQGVIVTPADGKLLDPALYSQNGTPGGQYATLNPIVITETGVDDFFKGLGTLVLNLPALAFGGNWVFNTSHSITTSVTTLGSPKVSVELFDISPTSITFVVSVTNDNKTETVTISGIEVQAIDGYLSNVTTNITSSGTALINGLPEGTIMGELSLDPDAPVPVELTSFSAIVNESSVILNWRTETEVNNYGFEIHRTYQEEEWKAIGFVEGHGNSNSPKEYKFIDSETNSAETYSYRLKQIDNDGTYEFSKTIEVYFGLPNSLELSQNYPNPFNPSTAISFTLPQSSNVILNIYNIMGEEIKTLVDGYKDAGIYTVKFNAEGYPSGIYLYTLSANGFSETKKLLYMK